MNTATLLIALMLMLPKASADTALKASEDGARLNVRTPELDKTYFGGRDFQDLSDYKVVIPAESPSRISGIQKLIPVATTPLEPLTNTTMLAAPKTQSPQNIEELIEKANALYYQGEYAESLLLVEQVLRQDPNHARGWLMKGSLYLVLGQREQATVAWQKAKELEKSK